MRSSRLNEARLAQAEMAGPGALEYCADEHSECVQKKMRIIMAEKPDTKPDQALAIAYSYCGEK